MPNTNNPYAPVFKQWPVKQLGNKPADDLLQVAHAFGRAGKQSLALALAMRPEGVTQGQIQIACGAPQNNHRIGLIRAGYFKRDMTAPKTDAGHTVYRITLTTKGEQAMKKRLEAAAKAEVDGGKPAKVSKPRKAKKAKADAATPAPATVQADSATAEQATA